MEIIQFRWRGGVVVLALLAAIYLLVYLGKVWNSPSEITMAWIGVVLAVGIPMLQRLQGTEDQLLSDFKTANLVGWRIYTAMLKLRDDVDTRLIEFDKIDRGTREPELATKFVITVPEDVDACWQQFTSFPLGLSKTLTQGLGLLKLHNSLMLELDATSQLVGVKTTVVYRREFETCGDLIHRSCVLLAEMLKEETIPRTRTYQPQ